MLEQRPSLADADEPICVARGVRRSRSGSDARATGTSVCLHWRDEDKNATFTFARLDPETTCNFDAVFTSCILETLYSSSILRR
jgi:hypothetical protein